ncbi:MAG: hypothetical protein N2114_02475, partial [Candidatus Goldbacteria bacterium]|nr:hypothetical protein [Candidatus Goldiibacteriota bacterium]
MFRKFVIMSVFIIFILVACAGIESKDNTNITKARMPVRLQPSDTLISFVIEGITFAPWQKTVLTNAENLARRYNLTFDLATFAEYLNKKNKDAWKIYEDNQDVFEIIAGGFNNVNPVEPKRT